MRIGAKRVCERDGPEGHKLPEGARLQSKLKRAPQVPPKQKSDLLGRIFTLEVPGGLEPPYSVLQTDT